MLSLANISATQAENYYRTDDYYTKGQDQAQDTRWFGRGAAALGLEGAVDAVVFKKLLHGETPQGSCLHARRIDPATHRAATDYTFSAPKSVSIAALIQGDRRALEAHDQAVRTTLSVLEERYAQTRVRTPSGRQRVTTGNIAAALFRHETSREQDPQLHSHAVVINATQMPDGTWRSLSNDEIIAHQKLLGEIYQNELAFNLRRLGYEIEPRANGQFELKGYSQEMLEVFSTRTRQIEAYLERWEQKLEEGKPLHTSQKKQATLNTRHAKRLIPREVLLEGWQQQIQDRRLVMPPPPQQEQNLGDSSCKNAAIAINEGIAHCSEREAVFRSTKIERFALEHYLGQQQFHDLQEAIQSSSELIHIEPSSDKYTTQAAVQRELETIRLMQKGQGRVEAIATPELISQHLEQFPTLTQGQRQAIERSATTQDQHIAWQGVAGAGKTLCLHLLTEIAQAQGYTVRGFAPSAEAAHVLQQSIQVAADTVAGLLAATKVEPEQGTDPEIWIVDEAGLLSAKDAHALLQAADRQRARVILVGDTRQLSAVEAGNPFKSLQAGGIQTAHLQESLRQKTQSLKTAVALVAEGHIVQGIETLEESGAICEISDAQQRLQQLARDYLSLSAEEREQTLLLAGTNSDRLNLTRQIRTALQQEGSLGEDVFTFQSLRPKDLTALEAKHAKHYEIGDVVVPLKDYKRQGLEKNQRYTVASIDSDGHRLTLQSPNGQLLTVDPGQCDRKTVYTPQLVSVGVGDRLRWTRNDKKAGTRNGQTFTVTSIDAQGNALLTYENGRTVSTNLNGSQYTDYALVSTVYSSQGKTADRVLVAIDHTTSREGFYVAISRAKYNLTLYSPDKAELIRLAQRFSAKQNASDYIPLFQIGQTHAQTQKDATNSHTSTDNCRDIGVRIGDRVGNCINQKFGASAPGDHQSDPPEYAVAAATISPGRGTSPAEQRTSPEFGTTGSTAAPDQANLRSLASAFASRRQRLRLRHLIKIVEAIDELPEQLEHAAGECDRCTAEIGNLVEQLESAICEGQVESGSALGSLEAIQISEPGLEAVRASDAVQLGRAQRILPIAVQFMQLMHQQGETVEIAPDCWQYEGRQYTTIYDKLSGEFSLRAAYGRGELVRCRNRGERLAIEHAQGLTETDLATFAYIEQVLEQPEQSQEEEVTR